MKSANISKQLSMNKEKEVRLMEVTDNKKKISIRRTSTLAGKIVENKLKSLIEGKTPKYDIDMSERKESESKGKFSEEDDNEKFNTPKNKNVEYQTKFTKSSKKSKSILSTDISEQTKISIRFPKLLKIRKSKWYQISYFI